MNRQDEFTERRSTLCLSVEQINDIADRAADKAIKNLTGEVYKSLGRTVIQQFFWILGVWVVAAYFWLESKGIIGK